LSFRQFRVQALVAALAVGALAVVVLIIGTQLLDAFHANVGSCAANCSSRANDFVNRYSNLGTWLDGLLLVVPGLVGVFWGAPLLARELESGTFRLAWTQSVSRTRWTLSKIAVLGLASMAVAGLCSLLVTWWSSPLDFVVGSGPFSHYDTRGIVPVAYAAFAFVLGVAAGAVIRRTVAAMGTTLVVFAGLRVAFVEWVRPHLMAPLTASRPFTVTSPRRVQVGVETGHGSWVVSESIVNHAGQAVNGAIAGLFDNLGQAVGPHGVTLPGVGSCPNLTPSGAASSQGVGIPNLVARCVNQLHLSDVVSYQPANRYWPFQIYESLIFFAAAVAVGAFTVWWVRRLN
jgi:hypothetical protein